MGSILRICKGYVLSMAVFVFLTFVGALAIKFTPFPESWGKGYVIGCLTLACLFVGLYISGVFQKAGILTGVLSSAVMILLVFWIVSICLGSFFQFSMLTPVCFVPLCSGALGGILGVNMKK